MVSKFGDYCVSTSSHSRREWYQERLFLKVMCVEVNWSVVAAVSRVKDKGLISHGHWTRRQVTVLHLDRISISWPCKSGTMHISKLFIILRCEFILAIYLRHIDKPLSY